jgi:hypothetical protein
MDASSMTPRDVQDGSLAPETTKLEDIPDELQLSNKKGGDTDEAIFYPGINIECYHGSRTKHAKQHWKLSLKPVKLRSNHSIRPKSIHFHLQ